jgi:hypothetical protein
MMRSERSCGGMPHTRVDSEVGISDGFCEGNRAGPTVGDKVGERVGEVVGTAEGLTERVGDKVGPEDGALEALGATVGPEEGALDTLDSPVGLEDGALEALGATVDGSTPGMDGAGEGPMLSTSARATACISSNMEITSSSSSSICSFCAARWSRTALLPVSMLARMFELSVSTARIRLA